MKFPPVPPSVCDTCCTEERILLDYRLHKLVWAMAHLTHEHVICLRCFMTLQKTMTYKIGLEDFPPLPINALILLRLKFARNWDFFSEEQKQRLTAETCIESGYLLREAKNQQHLLECIGFKLRGDKRAR